LLADLSHNTMRSGWREDKFKIDYGANAKNHSTLEAQCLWLALWKKGCMLMEIIDCKNLDP
jgi:hypothetical protein